jgi:N-acetylglucosamine-6-sulfatase
MLGAAAAPAAPARPNLVFILIDDLRYNALGCAGHPFAQTPHIDRIAKEGATFTNAFVTTPLCSPSRASYLTGRYVRSHGVKGNADNNALSHKLETFPKILNGAGYDTAYVGKWHMGNDDSPRPGFNRWVSFRGQGVYNDPPLNIDGQQVKANGYMTDLLSDHAAEFVRASRTKPFCLYLAHKAIHGPFTPAPQYATLYSEARIERTPNAQDTNEGKPALMRPIEKQRAPAPGGGSSDELIRNQLRCLKSIDDGVGRILASLEETRQLDNTLVVFTSDNGYFWGEHRLGDKRAAYEESIRIPMVARFPKRIKPGSKISQMALNVDIAPTMLDVGGVRPTKEMHGRSLAPLWSGKTKNWRRNFLCEYFSEPQYPRIPAWEAVRTEGLKYIHYTDVADSDELYDLQADPYEMKNLIGDGAARANLTRLQGMLEQYRKEIV